MKNLNFPLFITWNITSNCNLRCKHCFRSEYYCDELNKDKIDKLIDLFINKNVNRIILTGGEPLKSKNLFYIAEKLQGKIKLGIATNGTLLTNEIISRLLKYKIKDFQISLDGATEYYNDFIRGNGVYKKVISNIKKLLKFDCRVTLAMTVNSFNYDDILNNSISLVKSLGIKKLRIEYYIPINENKYLKSVSFEQMLALKNKLSNEKDEIELQMPTFDNNYGCGAGLYNCILNSDLSLSPCDLLTHKYKTNKMKNIDDFQKLWLDDVSFIKWREKSKCLSCKNNISCMALEEIKK